MRILILIYLILCCSIVSFATEDSTNVSPRQLIISGEFDAALEVLEPRLNQKPSFSDLYNAGVAYAEKKEYRKALGAFEAALKIDPSSNKAQSNAAFVYKKILPDSVWENPFTWTNRMIVSFRSFWIPAIVVSSLILAIVVFLSVSKVNVRLAWFKRLWLPTALILLLSLVALNKLNEYHTNHHLAITQKSEPAVYISPDGVPVKEIMNTPLRVNIQEYNKDSNWVSITYNHERFWLKTEDLFIY